jgi:hypothetical protein
MLCFDDDSDSQRTEEEQWSLTTCCEIISIADDATGVEPLVTKAKELGLIGADAEEKDLDKYLDKECGVLIVGPEHTGGVYRLEPNVYWKGMPSALYNQLLPLIIEGVLYFQNGLNELCRLVISNKPLSAEKPKDHKLQWVTFMEGPNEEGSYD